jgi:hypothetical protein
LGEEEQIMSRMPGIARACYAALVAFLVASCSGGGGGGGTPPQFVVSPGNLSFSAAGPNEATPPSQAITATVNGVSASTLFVRVVVTGPAVAAVDNLVITGPNSGRLSVHVAAPATIGPGSHASVITVTACTTDINCSGAQLTGSPATINVAYQVGTVPAPPQAVAPSVSAAGATGAAAEVVLRGSGFGSVTSVSFGATPADSFTVLSSTEIRARYASTLAAGPYPVSLTGSATPFTGSLLLVADTLASQTLEYPIPPQNMRGLAYDARNRALIVGTSFLNPLSNQVLRYAFNGTTWQTTPTIASIANLRDLTLSLDGERLLAITDTALIDMLPSTLAQQTSTPKTTNTSTPGDEYLKAIVATNDGQAVVLSSAVTGGFGALRLYDIARRAFSAPRDTFFHTNGGGGNNGARVLFMDGFAGPSAVHQYSASSGLVTTTTFQIQHNNPIPGQVENINPPMFDQNGSHILFSGFNGGQFYAIYDANFVELGRLPSGDLTATTAAYALSPGGTRAYILETGTALCRVRAFDLTSTAGPGIQFSQIGATIDLMPNCPATNGQTPIRMLVDPTGTTAFIAGNLRISVVTPLP